MTCVHPAFVRTPIHDATRAAGLQLEGFSHEEPIEQVIATIVGALESRKPQRDVAVTRGGAPPDGRRSPRPRLVDRVVARTLRKRIAAGDLDPSPIAGGLRERHGR